MLQDIFQVQLFKKQRLAKNTWQFVFEKPFNFLPGQFTTIFLDNDSRDFTIASSPHEKTFSIVTKKGISSFKKKLFSLPIGSVLSAKKPAGGFTLSEGNDRQYVLLAGGIGITPFYSMISYIAQRKITIKVTLLVSFSKKEDSIFYDILQKIASDNENIQIIYSFSQDSWEGEKGRISENLIKKYVPKIEDSEFLIAGGESMTYEMEELLLQMGVDARKIRLDIFTGY